MTWLRIPLVVATASSLLVTGTQVAHAQNNSDTPLCKGPARHTTLVQELNRNLRFEIRKQRHSTIRFALRDKATGVTCLYRESSQTYGRSITKVTLVAALFYKNKYLTRKQKLWAHRAITRSSNAAAKKLWLSLGQAQGLQRFLNAAKMRRTVPYRGIFWGNTLVTVSDELTLLRLLTDNTNRVLKRSHKNYILGLMSRVVPSQRWGISAGLPRQATRAIKNGWGPSMHAPGNWVNSIGSIRNARHTYEVAIITNNNHSVKSGIRVVNELSTAINSTFTKHPVP